MSHHATTKTMTDNRLTRPAGQSAETGIPIDDLVLINNTRACPLVHKSRGVGVRYRLEGKISDSKNNDCNDCYARPNCKLGAAAFWVPTNRRVSLATGEEGKKGRETGSDCYDLTTFVDSSQSDPALLCLRFRPMAFANCATPSAGFLAPIFYELFKTLKIVFNASRHYADRIAGILHEPFRIIGNL
jgi:hypothetical protein